MNRVNRLLIVNAHPLEPVTEQLGDRSWIELADGLIAATGTGAPPAVPGDVRVLDAAGATVLPGLIDAHVHLTANTLDPRERESWTPGYAAVRSLRAAEEMLARGFTTVRDVGGADHGLAQALREGLVRGPRLIHGGKALSQTGGHGDLRPLSEDGRPCCGHQPGFARIADGVEEVRLAARDELRKGAAHLKLTVSGGVASPHDEVSAVQYTLEEITAAVTEAGNAGRYVTVHAYGAKAINRALEAGARCVEHGNLLDDTTLKLLLDRDAYLVPTLVTYEQLAERGREAGLAEGSYRKIAEVREAGFAALDRAHRAGVNLVYGSDLLGPMRVAQLQEFTLRARVQPAAAVLRSATSTAARLLGQEGRLGTLAPGAHADLLVLDGDPLADLSVLTRPERHLRHVIQAGAVVS
ncbi:amidohydrolase family protein [Nonomuraea sp. NPDC050328]|uniref:amidohydrolase family protein n=1 Tax=Nonomuraea sp. NPDC050328 TaxID=3364361 RepID=UPI0037965C0E